MNHVSFIWNIAESLRGPFKPSEYGSVVLPFTVLRRLDAVLADTKGKVLEVAHQAGNLPDLQLREASGHEFYNMSQFTMAKLVADPADLRENFHPRTVSNIQMGLVFEELIRFANEKSNETAGDHYTPREVIALMVQLLFALDDDALSKSGVVRSIYDPTAGTGGMLSVADEYLRKMNPGIQLSLYGQDYNDASYAICKADMVIKGQDVDNIRLGDTLTEDHFDDKKFDYALS
ncbi:N-6 DNA methylase [Agromyces sp. MMS24-JH15]|uniref:type I restriction-modification system subunit M n=1 Tax=Agromyces sp. MMS24-JH15 TaxID=3243765 RepID=UPI00374A298D